VLIRIATAAVLVVLSCGTLAGPALAVDAEKPFAWPTTGRITQPYGCTGFWAEPRRGSCAHFHGGIDIADRRGTSIRAAADGVISHVGWDPWMSRRYASWMVIINHGGGLQTMYAHLQHKDIDEIRRGARVSQGDLIGRMGSTGMSTGPHLHFSVINDGRWVNPRNFLSGKPTRRKPQPQQQERPQVSRCRSVGALAADALTGGATAVVLEFNDPATCAA
jgi:murein DD-endopeptidase MepM/ murein hydrolase activator NlpD